MSRPSLIVPASSSSYLYPLPPSTPSTFATVNPNSPPTIILTLWVHDDPFSKQETYINTDLFSPGSINPGDIISVRPVDATSPLEHGAHGHGAHGRDDRAGPMSAGGVGGAATEKSMREEPRAAGSTASGGKGKGKNGAANCGAEFLFVVREKEDPPNVKGMQGVRDLQISVSSQVAALFGFRPRMSVFVTVTQKSLHEASHIEVIFRDQYIARSDMWRLAASELADKCVYRGKKIIFVGSIKATVKSIYVRGEKVYSAYFSSRTKPIFRSESARFILLVQMSREMWHFDTEGSGEVVFNKLVNGFLPELFMRWGRKDAHHLVSIVLFTRILYEKDQPGSQDCSIDASGRRYKDFFRVVISNNDSSERSLILNQLKREFNTFMRDVLIQPVTYTTPAGPDEVRPESVIAGTPSAAIHGNILESINLAYAQFARDFIDRDLVHTGISVIIVTPGTGHFEVDYDTLKMTTDNLVGNGLGIDLVCLSKQPLHSVPIFKYRNPVPISTLHNDSDSRSFISLKESKQKRREKELGIRGLAGLGSPPPGVVGPFAPSHPYRIAISPPKFAPTLEPGEWVFALPHWIDVSFWSTPEHTMGNLLELTLSKKMRRKKRKGTFFPRCKMYEVMMMGVSQNEAYNLSIPHLTEDPFYEDPVAAGSGGISNERRKDLWEESDPLAWMDEYDEMQFVSLEEYKMGVEKKRLARAVREEERLSRMAAKEDASLLGTSFRDESASRTPLTGAALRGAYFERRHHHPGQQSQLRDRRGSIEDNIDASPASTASEIAQSPPVNTTIAQSTSSTALSVLSRPARFARQISFGFRGLSLTSVTPVKAQASTAISMSTAGGESPILTRGFKPEQALQDVPRTPISPTKRKDSGFIRKDDGMDSSRFGASARPIAIKSSSERDEKPSTPKKETPDSPFETRLSQKDMFKPASLTRISTGSRLDLPNAATAAAAAPVAPVSLSPTSALAPWFLTLNPSNPKKNRASMASQYRRWQHVFPRPLPSSAMKWKSLCSPAALPLTTEHFPTAEQLQNEYQENPYVISNEEDGNREELVREMISQRLAQGFQIVVGTAVAEATAGRGGDPNVFDRDFMRRAGSSVFMSMGSQIHQLILDEHHNVEVKRYVRKPTTAIRESISMANEYAPYIRTLLKSEYVRRTALVRNHSLNSEYNWNYVDMYIAGEEDVNPDQLRFWSARFLLIPTDLPANTRKDQGNKDTDDTDEELRIIGIEKLLQVFQRHRFLPPSEQEMSPLMPTKKRGRVPLEIHYNTLDPSLVVTQQLESQALSEIDPSLRRSQLITDLTLFERHNTSLKTIAAELQSPRGVRMQDRRWHFRYHKNCFIGSELVIWLMENFKDIDSRADSVDFGNELMRKGLFVHVAGRHSFRDGNYFYQLCPEWQITQPPPLQRPSSKGGWLSRKTTTERPASVTAQNSSSSGLGLSALGTPSETSSPGTFTRSRSSSIMTEATATTSSTQEVTNTPRPLPLLPRRKILLSRMIKYDVDPGKKSYRSEPITLHYDILHNPDNCYHLRISWLNTTSKLIEDALTSWARTVNPYGLKLIEAPIAELSQLTVTNPFRSPIRHTLALAPPPNPPPAAHGIPDARPHALKYYWQHLVLRRAGFLLDTEAASNFPPDTDVRYSWGPPDYQRDQFVHRSGLLFAQVDEEGGILMLANRLYSQRLGPRWGTGGNIAREGGGGSGVGLAPTRRDAGLAGKVLAEVESVIRNPTRLRQIYEEAGWAAEEEEKTPLGPLELEERKVGDEDVLRLLPP